MKKFAVELMEKFGSFEFTLKTLDDLERQAGTVCSALGENPHIVQLFEILKVDAI